MTEKWKKTERRRDKKKLRKTGRKKEAQAH